MDAEKKKPVDAPPTETPVDPNVPGGPPVKPADGEDPPQGQPPGVPVGPGKTGG